jgi:putative RecB family exonuclease
MPIYSHSSLEAYQNCPAMFCYRYVDREASLKKGIELYLGSRVHQVLEKLYKDLSLTKLNTLEEILEYYQKEWEKNWSEEIVIVRKEYTAQHYRQLGEKYIKDFYQRYFPFDREKSLGIEEMIIFDLDEKGNYKIKGVIDRLVEKENGFWEIHDYKTNKKLPEQKDLDQNRQLALYQIGIESKWKEIKNIQLVWHYLHFDKELRSERTPQELERLKKETIELIKEIEKAKEKDDFPTNESALCDWCDYSYLCPVRKHFEQTVNLPANEFLSLPEVQLVNKYVELSEIIRDHREELEKLKEAIFSVATKENLLVIRGSDNKLKIKFENGFPTKEKEPERKLELEKLIKVAGKWEEVSFLNAKSLLKIITDEKWEKELIQKLKKFIIPKAEKRIYLSRLRDEETL